LFVRRLVAVKESGMLEIIDAPTHYNDQPPSPLDSLSPLSSTNRSCTSIPQLQQFVELCFDSFDLRGGRYV
jgi:hypothetical protein